MCGAEAGESNRGEALRLLGPMQAMEALRGAHGEIRVLHDAVSQSGLAGMGPLLPPMSPVDAAHQEAIARAARALRQAEQEIRAASAA